MEKSTISALIVAGGTVLGAVVQVLVLRAARRQREARQAAAGDEGKNADERGKNR